MESTPSPSRARQYLILGGVEEDLDVLLRGAHAERIVAEVEHVSRGPRFAAHRDRVFHSLRGAAKSTAGSTFP